MVSGQTSELDFKWRQVDVPKRPDPACPVTVITDALGFNLSQLPYRLHIQTWEDRTLSGLPREIRHQKVEVRFRHVIVWLGLREAELTEAELLEIVHDIVTQVRYFQNKLSLSFASLPPVWTMDKYQISRVIKFNWKLKKTIQSPRFYRFPSLGFIPVHTVLLKDGKQDPYCFDQQSLTGLSREGASRVADILQRYSQDPLI